MKKQADYIKRIEIKGMWGRKNISWDLRADVNILSGVNGIGKRNIQAGVAVNRMHDRTGNELDAEATCLVPLNDWLSVQPAMHFIRSHSREIVVGMLRFSVAFGNK